MTDRSPTIEIRVEPEADTGTRTIALSGELDSATCAQLGEAFERALAGGELNQLVLDLQRVTFVDSAGTRTLIWLERQAAERGVSLKVKPAPEEVTALLRLAGLAQRVNLTSSVTETSDLEEFLERIDVELQRQPTSPAQARAEVRQGLGSRVDEAELATLVLLTSELTTNAVIHPRDCEDPRLGLRVTIYPQRVRVQVDDPGSGFDPATSVQATDWGGRGLMLVERAASRWGVGPAPTPRGQRFAVWFDVDLAQPEAPAAGT